MDVWSTSCKLVMSASPFRQESSRSSAGGEQPGTRDNNSGKHQTSKRSETGHETRDESGRYHAKDLRDSARQNGVSGKTLKLSVADPSEESRLALQGLGQLLATARRCFRRCVSMRVHTCKCMKEEETHEAC
eukprot:4948214-Pleurochrysis_carterae.AAC.2